MTVREDCWWFGCVDLNARSFVEQLHWAVTLCLDRRAHPVETFLSHPSLERCTHSEVRADLALDPSEVGAARSMDCGCEDRTGFESLRPMTFVRVMILVVCFASAHGSSPAPLAGSSRRTALV